MIYVTIISVVTIVLLIGMFLLYGIKLTNCIKNIKPLDKKTQKAISDILFDKLILDK